MMRYWGNNMMGWGSGFGAFGGIIKLLFWIVVVVGIMLLAIWLAKSRSGSDNKPLDILKERYAKGEISKEEFEEKKKEMGL